MRLDFCDEIHGSVIKNIPLKGEIFDFSAYLAIEIYVKDKVTLRLVNPYGTDGEALATLGISYLYTTWSEIQ